MKCRNLCKDKKTGEYFCRSTHVCYKPYCKEPDLFTAGYKAYRGAIRTFEEVEKMKKRGL